MAKTPENAERFRKWLDSMMAPPSATVVRRLARYVTWKGVTRDNPRGVYRQLSEIGQQDYTNPVLIELGWWKP